MGPRRRRGGGVVAVRLSSIVAYGRSNSCRLAASSFYFGDRFINMEMVSDGFAWRYPQYDKPGEFTAAEADAREHQRGLWADPNPMPPWEWRRARRQSSKPAR